MAMASSATLKQCAYSPWEYKMADKPKAANEPQHRKGKLVHPDLTAFLHLHHYQNPEGNFILFKDPPPSDIS